MIGKLIRRFLEKFCPPKVRGIFIARFSFAAAILYPVVADCTSKAMAEEPVLECGGIDLTFGNPGTPYSFPAGLLFSAGFAGAEETADDLF